MKYILFCANILLASNLCASAPHEELDKEAVALVLYNLQFEAPTQNAKRTRSCYQGAQRKRAKKPFVYCSEHYYETKSWFFDNHVATHHGIVEGCGWCDLGYDPIIPQEVTLARKCTNEAFVSE